MDLCVRERRTNWTGRIYRWLPFAALILLLAGCAGNAPRPADLGKGPVPVEVPKPKGPGYVLNSWILACGLPEAQLQIDGPLEPDPAGYWEGRSGGSPFRTNAPVIQRLGDQTKVEIKAKPEPATDAPAEALMLIACGEKGAQYTLVELPAGGATFHSFGVVQWDEKGERRTYDGLWFWAAKEAK